MNDPFDETTPRHEDPEERAASSSTVISPDLEEVRDWRKIYAGLVDLDAVEWPR